MTSNQVTGGQGVAGDAADFASGSNRTFQNTQTFGASQSTTVSDRNLSGTEGTFSGHPIVGLTGSLALLAGALTWAAASNGSLPAGAYLGLITLSSLLVLPILAVVIDLRRSDIIDHAALTMVAASVGLVVAAAWFWLLTAGSLPPAAPVAGPLLVAGGVLLSLFLVARKTHGIAGIYNALIERAGSSPDESRELVLLQPFTFLGGGISPIVSKGEEVILGAGVTVPADVEIVRGSVTAEERFLSGVPRVRVLDEREVLFGGSRILAGDAVGRTLSGTRDACLALLERVIALRFSRAALEDRVAETTARRSTLLALIFCSVAAAISFSERYSDLTASLVAGGAVLFCALFAVLRDALLIQRLRFLVEMTRRGVVVPTFDQLEVLARCTEVAFEFPVVDAQSSPQACDLRVLDDRVGAEELASTLLSLVGRAETELFRSVAAVCHRTASDFTPQRVLDLRETADAGISGVVHGVSFAVGTEEYLVERGVHFQPADFVTEGSRAHQDLFVAVGADVVALFSVEIGVLAPVKSGQPIARWSPMIASKVYTGTTSQATPNIQQLVVRAAAPNVSISKPDASSAAESTIHAKEVSAALEASPLPQMTIAIPRDRLTLLGRNSAGVLGEVIVQARSHILSVNRIGHALQAICILGVVSTFLGALTPLAGAVCFPMTLLATRYFGGAQSGRAHLSRYS